MSEDSNDLYDDGYNDGFKDGVTHAQAGVNIGLGIVGYFLIAFFTFATVFEGFGVVNEYNKIDRNIGSTLAGVFWPVYWGGRGALMVMRSRDNLGGVK